MKKNNVLCFVCEAPLKGNLRSYASALLSRFIFDVDAVLFPGEYCPDCKERLKTMVAVIEIESGTPVPLPGSEARRNVTWTNRNYMDTFYPGEYYAEWRRAVLDKGWGYIIKEA